jgi:N-alpha-acetyltransferase 30
MAPKKGSKSGGGLDIIPADHAGMTKQQQEDEELKRMQQMAAEIYSASQAPKAPKTTGAGKSKKAVAQQKKNDETVAKRRADAERTFEEAHARLMHAAVYVNEEVKLTQGIEWHELAPGKWIRYAQFDAALDLEPLIQLMTVSLSEPYNAFTYKHFLSSWPDLGICLFGVKQADKPAAGFRGELIGCAVSKVSRKHPARPLRGYIAMLAVAESFRGHKLGQSLVTVTVDLMKAKKVEEVCLETPTSNERALNLYLSLGFIKHKFLTRYYLDGQDAVRLKLWLASPFDQPSMTPELKAAFNDFNRSMAYMRALEAQEGGAIGDMPEPPAIGVAPAPAAAADDADDPPLLE